MGSTAAGGRLAERWCRTNEHEREVAAALPGPAHRGFCFGRSLSSSAAPHIVRAPAQFLSAHEARAAMQRIGNLDEMRLKLGVPVSRPPKLCAAGRLRVRDAYLRLTESSAERA